MNELVEILEKIWLTENESIVYYTSLQLWEASILDIAKKAWLNRSVVHVVVEKLIRENILLSSQGTSKRKITARTPDYLRELLRRQQRELRKKEIKFEEYLPKLRQIQKWDSNEYKVTIIDWKKWMNTWSDMVLEESITEMLEFARIEEFAKKTDSYLQNEYFPKKAEIWLPTRFIFVDTPYARKYIEKNYILKKDSAPMVCKLIPDSTDLIKWFMVVWNNNLWFYSSKEDKVTIMRDENIANHEKAFFNLVWENAWEIFTNRPNDDWEKIVRNFEQKRKWLISKVI